MKITIELLLFGCVTDDAISEIEASICDILDKRDIEYDCINTDLD